MLLELAVVHDILIKTGWMAADGPSTSPFADAVKRFQAFYGLEPDGEINPATERAVAARAYYGCGNSDIQQTGNLCQWKRGMEVKYCVVRTPNGLAEEEARLAFRRAFASWEQVCDIKFYEKTSPDTANIIIDAGRGNRVGFDGPSGVLAWSEMPCGNQGPLKQMYDLAERFGTSTAGGAIVLENVACHEIGHAIGISHISPSLGPALMNPTYSPRVAKPLTLDIAEAVKRYGSGSAPTPPTPPPNETQRTIIITGASGITVDGKAV